MSSQIPSNDISQATNQSVAKGFTLIEVMVALTITLLMMGALGQAFSYVGRRIQAGRAQVELSSKARSIAVQFRDDLTRLTVPVAAPLPMGSVGYFMYYEGPMSDATAAAYGERDVIGPNEVTYLDSRWGDYDDYVAFTVKAPLGSWFNGKVPRFVVDPAVFQDPSLNPFEPVNITSQYAEVVYWVTPIWERKDSTLPTVPDNIRFANAGGATTANELVPMFVDNDGTSERDEPPDANSDNNDNGIPDRLVLRRRVLLIRDDLNMPNGQLPVPPSGTQFQDDFWFHKDRTTSPITRFENLAPGAKPADGRQAFNENWLVGLQLAYQMCDLSVSRVIETPSGGLVMPFDDTNWTSLPPITDLRNPLRYPATGVRANSLSDLNQPHNRFAHVRIPGEYFFAVNPSNARTTTMPVLALTRSTTLPLPQGLTNVNFSAATNNQLMPMFNGFVLPHFELNSFASTLLGPSIASSLEWDRTGEDIIAEDVLAFDMQIYDQNAPLLLSNGPDNLPGTALVDDNQDGTPDNLLEQGAAGSDDLIITFDDPGSATILNSSINPHPGLGVPSNSTIVARGSYVDLSFPMQPGNPIHNHWFTSSTNASLVASTQYSGIHGLLQRDSPLTSSTAFATSDSLRGSGRALFRIPTGTATDKTKAAYLLFQPAFDTYSNAYREDEWRHKPLPNNPLGGAWWEPPRTNAGASTPPVNVYAPNSAAAPLGLSEDIPPPFSGIPDSVQLRIRLEDPSTRQFKQLSVVEDFGP